jgi:hypothetical protein
MDRSLRAPFRLRLRIVMLIMFFIAAAMIALANLFFAELMYHRSRLPRLLFDIAYSAFASGRDEAVEPLLRAAIYQQAELLAVGPRCAARLS